MPDDDRVHPWNTTGPMELDFTDRAGNRWTVIDFMVPGLPGSKKKRVPISNWRADGRAFVPVEHEAPIMIYVFDAAPNRYADPRCLEGQLQFARPLHASAADRLNGGAWNG